MRILIIGASGFIGSHLARYITSQGQEIVALSRTCLIPNWSGTCLKWEFGQPIPEAALNNIECAIHLAHDFNGAEGAQLTRISTLENIEQLRSAGVKRQLYFSSYSAGKHATSLYGRTKLAIEQLLISNHDIVIVRPGLVLGNGGIYGRIKYIAQRFRFIPLPNGGQGLIPVITLDRLCRETLDIAMADTPEPEANLFEKQLRSLRQLVLESVAEDKQIPWIISVPATLVNISLKAAEIMHIPLPVNADNLAGFLANQDAQHVSTLQD